MGEAYEFIPGDEKMYSKEKYMPRDEYDLEVIYLPRLYPAEVDDI